MQVTRSVIAPIEAVSERLQLAAPLRDNSHALASVLTDWQRPRRPSGVKQARSRFDMDPALSANAPATDIPEVFTLALRPIRWVKRRIALKPDVSSFLPLLVHWHGCPGRISIRYCII